VFPSARGRAPQLKKSSSSSHTLLLLLALPKKPPAQSHTHFFIPSIRNHKTKIYTRAIPPRRLSTGRKNSRKFVTNPKEEEDGIQKRHAAEGGIKYNFKICVYGAAATCCHFFFLLGPFKNI
jgi:hypothetical protein